MGSFWADEVTVYRKQIPLCLETSFFGSGATKIPELTPLSRRFLLRPATRSDNLRVLCGWPNRLPYWESGSSSEEPEFMLEIAPREANRFIAAMIRQVVVLGGGSAGLLAALSLKIRLPQLAVRVVFSRE